MRPRTLSQAIERIAAGTAMDIALGEFLDHFYTSPHEERRRALKEEPRLLDELHLDALAAAIAEHLSKSWLDEGAPAWAEAPSRFLARPWFTAKNADAGLRTYLTYQSPAAFKRRNIMTDGAPLRRATTPKASFNLSRIS